MWIFAYWCAYSFVLYLLITSFLALVNDNLIVSSQLQQEYNQRFVYPRLYYSRKDQSTSTEDDMAREVVKVLDDQLEDVNDENTIEKDPKYSSMWQKDETDETPVTRNNRNRKDASPTSSQRQRRIKRETIE